MSLTERLEAQGVTLPEVPRPVAAYVPAVTCGQQVFVSGQLPLSDGKLLATGKVPSQCEVQQAAQAARQCVLNGLAAVRAELGGDLSRLVRVVKLTGFVQSDDDFHGQPTVINGASELLEALLGEAGKHARAAVGVNALPLNAAVEIEFLFEVR
jgi:enamine deaminase RidA (YjgF/YER057c/UK114 family)